MKNFNVLTTMRNSRGFSRGVAYTIIIALVALVTERVIYYTLLDGGLIKKENVVEKIQRMNPVLAQQLKLPKYQPQKHKEKTATEKVSKTVLDVQYALDYLSVKRNSEDETKTLATLQQLKTDLNNLDKKALQDFAKTQAHITQHKLDPIIQQRQDKAVATYKTEMATLLTNLNNIELAQTSEQRKAAIDVARAHLESKQLERSKQHFDPENIPFKSRQPDKNNTPKLTKDAFAKAGLFDTPHTQVAALGDFTYDKLVDATNPAYLAETDEVVLTQAIKDQAEALEYDPVKIYQWVHNNVEWLPTWGAMQDSDVTLGSKRGNAMDIASLHIALLRASQIPARYVHGTIEIPMAKFNNWIGNFNSNDAAVDFAASGGIPSYAQIKAGKIDSVKIEHIWVEVAADFFPSRAVVNKDADSWIQLDASFKQYDYLTGVDVAAVTGIDGQALADSFLASGTVNEAEGWVQGFDATILQSAQTQAQTDLSTYITTNLPSATVGDVIGGKRTIVKLIPGLPSSLENPIVVTGSRYNKIPASLQARLGVSLGLNELRQQLPDVTLPWAKINNHKLMLSFRGQTASDQAVLDALIPEGVTDISQLPTQVSAYLVMVVPELKLNGVVVGSGQPMRLGDEARIRFNVSSPIRGSEYFYSPIIAGSYLALATGGGSVSENKLSMLKERIEATKDVLESGDTVQQGALTKDDILGDMFYSGVLGYYAQFTALNYLVNHQKGSKLSLLPSIGTFGYVPKVNYFFGFPANVFVGGIEMDLDSTFIAVADSDDTKAGRKKLVQQAGTIGSTLEHTIPEQMFVTTTNPGEAISAVKALSKATTTGQRIYQINQENMASVLPNINHSPFVMSEITSALNAGFEVITHTDAVSIPGWSGAGYVILDAEKGDGVYKIETGTNGSFFWIGVVYGVIIQSLLYVVDNLPLKGITSNPIFVALILAITSAFIIYGAYLLIYGQKEADCFRLGIINGMGGVAILKTLVDKKIIGASIAALLLGIADAKFNVNECIN